MNNTFATSPGLVQTIENMQVGHVEVVSSVGDRSTVYRFFSSRVIFQHIIIAEECGRTLLSCALQTLQWNSRIIYPKTTILTQTVIMKRYFLLCPNP